jgi:hypothetical protein
METSTMKPTDDEMVKLAFDHADNDRSSGRASLEMTEPDENGMQWNIPTGHRFEWLMARSVKR